MSARRRWRAGLLALILGGSGCGEDPSGSDSAVPSGDIAAGGEPHAGRIDATWDDAAERLIASPPEGWVETGALETPVLRMAEYGPRDQPADVLERLTFEAQSGKPLPDPIGFVTSVAGDLQARCKGFQQINISSGLENGYPTSVRLMICPEFRDSPYSQVVVAKAIQGDERFYVITRRLRGPALPPVNQSTEQPGASRQPMSAQAMAEWTTRMKAVHVCNTDQPDGHPCPRPDAVELPDDPDQPRDVTAPATPAG